MGKVAKPTQWWGRVEKTQDHEGSLEPVVIQPTSLDVLSDQVSRAMNNVVHCQAELVRAQVHLEQCQQAWINRMLEVAQQNGIREFKFKPTPKRGDEE